MALFDCPGPGLGRGFALVMPYSYYAGTGAHDGYDADDDDGSSDLVENLKKQAIEEVKTRTESAQGVLATDPKSWATAGSGGVGRGRDRTGF